MKSFLFPAFALVSTAASAVAADAPKLLAEFLTPNVYIKGEIVVVVPPPDLDKYVAKVEKSAKAQPEWFAEHSKKAKPGVPLPWDEKLGLTKEEYDEYLKLWSKREFKPLEGVILQLKEGKDSTWSINVAGSANFISLLKYDPKADVFKSLNGPMKRLDDVSADPNSTLGAWSGHEWKFEDQSTLDTTKENMAVGKTGDGKYGLIVYRMQEVSSAGTLLMDKGLVIRFLLGEAGFYKSANAPAGSADDNGGASSPAAPQTPKTPSNTKPKKK